MAARFVAGDFYDVFHLTDGAVGVVVADVAGKGIGASLVMASVKAVLPLIAADRTVEETLGALNRKLSVDLGPRDFVALAYLRYEKSGAFTLGNAGLPTRISFRPARPRGRSPCRANGCRSEPVSESRYGSLSGRLEPGERLLLLTDGLPEALMATDEPLGYPAFEALLAASDSDARRILDGLFRQVREGVRAHDPGRPDRAGIGEDLDQGQVSTCHIEVRLPLALTADVAPGPEVACGDLTLKAAFESRDGVGRNTSSSRQRRAGFPRGPPARSVRGSAPLRRSSR